MVGENFRKDDNFKQIKNKVRISGISTGQPKHKKEKPMHIKKPFGVKVIDTFMVFVLISAFVMFCWIFGETLLRFFGG